MYTLSRDYGNSKIADVMTENIFALFNDSVEIDCAGMSVVFCGALMIKL